MALPEFFFSNSVTLKLRTKVKEERILMTKILPLWNSSSFLLRSIKCLQKLQHQWLTSMTSKKIVYVKKVSHISNKLVLFHISKANNFSHYLPEKIPPVRPSFSLTLTKQEILICSFTGYISLEQSMSKNRWV